MAKRESKFPVSFQVRYQDVRRAFFALAGLISGNVKEGGKSYNPEFSLKTIMKIKRMMGVMTPLIRNMEEEEKKIAAEFGWSGDVTNVPEGLNEKFDELYSVPCTVGCDVLTSADFAHLSSIPIAFVGSLLEFGPFLMDDAAEIGISAIDEEVEIYE